MADGSLHFKAGVDKRDFDNAIKSIENSIKGMSDVSEKEATGMDKTFEKLGKSIKGSFDISKKIEEQKQSIKSLESDLKNLNTQIENTDPGKMFDSLNSRSESLRKQIAAEKEALRDYENELKNTTKTTQSESNKMISSFNLLAGIISGSLIIDSFTGVTPANIEIQKNVIKSLEDEYRKLNEEIKKIDPYDYQSRQAIESRLEQLKREISAERQGLQDLGDEMRLQQKISTGISPEDINLQKDAIQHLEKSLKELNKEIEKMAPGRAQAAKKTEASALARELEYEKKVLEEFENSLKKTSKTAEKETSKIKSSFGKMGAIIGGYLSAQALMSFTQNIIKIRGEMQKAELTFSTMLRSQEKAKELTNELVDLASTSPLSLQELTDGAERLLAFNVSAEEVTDTLKRLGDIATGLGVPLGRLSTAYTQVMSKGKLTGNELRIFATAGVPILAELARQLNKTEAEIQKMISSGSISFDHVNKALIDMTNSGGMFYNLMEKQSDTLIGKTDTLRGKITQAFNEIGESNQGILGKGIDALTSIVEHYKEIAEIIGSLLVSYGAYRTALISINAVKSANITLIRFQAVNSITLTGVQKALTLSTLTARNAMRSLNLTMLANPAFWLVAALGALIYTVYKVTTAETAAEKVARKYNEALEERKKIVQETKANAEELNRILSDDDATQYQKTRAFEELKLLLPGLVGDMTEYEYTAKLASGSQKMLNIAIDDFNAKTLRDEITESEEKVSDFKKQIESLNNVINNPMTDGRILSVYRQTIKELTQRKELEESLLQKKKEQQAAEAEAMRIAGLSSEQRIAELEKEKDKYQEVADTLKKKLNEVESSSDLLADSLSINLEKMFNQYILDGYLSKIKEINKEIGKIIPETTNQDKAYWEKQKKEAQEIVDSLDSKNIEKTKEYQKALKDYQEAEKELSKYNLGQRKSASKKADEILPKGSVAEIQKRLSKIDEQLSKTPSMNQTQIEKLKQERIKLAEELAEAQKAIEIKTLSETIDENLSKWEMYYKSVELYGKGSTSANPYFANMGADSMLDYVQKQINELKKIENPTNEMIQLLIKLREKFNEIQGIDDPFTAFKKSLKDLKESSENSFDYLTKLKQILGSLEADGSPEYFQKRDELEKEIQGTQKALEDSFKSMLDSQKDFSEKRLDIEREYQEQLKYIEQQTLLDTEFDSFGALSKLQNWKNKQLDEIAQSEIEAMAEWEIVFSNLGQYSKKAITIAIQEIRNELSKMLAEGKITEAEYDKIIQKLNAAEQGFRSEFERIINDFKKAIGNQDPFQFGTALQEASGMFQQMADDVIGIFENITGESAEMARQILGDITNIATGFGEIIEGIGTGNPIAVISGIGKVVKTVTDWISGDRKRERAIKRHKEAIEELKNAYERLQFAIETALGEDKYQKQGALIQNLIQQQEQLIKIREQELKKKKTDKNAVNEYTNQIEALKEQIERIKQSITEDITQTSAKSLSEELATALENAYARGEDAAIAWGRVADDVMNQAIRNALRVKFLEEPLKKAVDDLRKSMGFDEYGQGSFDGLTDAERQKFKDQIKNASDAYRQALEALGDDFGFGAQNSLQGAIKGVTEETAGLIEGQMNAIRINQSEMLEIQQHQYQLSQTVVNQLQDIVTYTSKLVGIANDLNDLRNYIIL